MRRSGILMHISSLPSRYGIGKLGASAYQFADFLKKSGVSVWQILPLSPTSYGDSPYQSFSLMPEIHISSTLNSWKNKVCSNTPIMQMPTGAAQTKLTTNASIRCAFRF